MRAQFLIIVLITISTIACHRSSSPIEKAEIEKEQFADDILRKVATKLKQETGLIPCGTIGQMLNKVQVLGLSFNYYLPADIVEGRKMLIQAINSLMDEVNQEKRIHPYLSRYPFTSRNIEIHIYLRSPEGRDVTPGALWIIEASEGFLHYKIDNPATHRLTDIYKETYDEALERIKDPSLPLVSFEPSPEISQEELVRLRKGICFVSNDGSIWHLGDDGCWIKDPKSQQQPKTTK
jgi:hypothetical protein